MALSTIPHLRQPYPCLSPYGQEIGLEITSCSTDNLDVGLQTIVYYLELKNEVRQSGSTSEFGTENHEAEM